MTEANAVAEGQATPGTEGEAGTPPKKSKLKLIILIAAPLLLLGIGGGVAYFMGFFGSSHKEEAKKAEPSKEGESHKEGEAGKEAAHEEKKAEGDEASKADHPVTAVYFQLPEMMINLNAEGNKISYLKLQASLEISDQKDEEKLKKLMPRIQDTIQVYIRELKVADLRSSIGVEKLRQELLKRMQLIAKDVKITDILFPQMLTQ